jgi:PadR family transcriptional regulator PadR
MRKGALEYCILALLRDRNRYGLEMISALRGVDGMLVADGTLYPILSRLKAGGRVRSYLEESGNGPARKYYGLTSAGEAALREFEEHWSGFKRSVDMILVDGGKL